MHRSRLAQILVDVAPGDHDATVGFWSGALGRPARPHGEEYTFLGGEIAGEVTFYLQRLEAGPSRVHLDLETDDLDAEVARLERLGATRVEMIEDWQVMRDPAGLVFCVLPREKGSLDDTDAAVWD